MSTSKTIDEIKKRLKKSKAKMYSLEDDYAGVKDFIPTGAYILDCILKRGGMGGIPVGKITSLEGLFSTGKSYLAIQIAKEAAKKDIIVFYGDSEHALDADFAIKAGVPADKFIYLPLESCEKFFEFIEEVIDTKQKDERFLFIWDSVANTVTEAESAGSYDPSSQMAVKARVLSRGMAKLLTKLGESQCTLLALNQLKDNIPSGPMAHVERMKNPYFAPGGKAFKFASNLIVWLINRNSNNSYVKNEREEIVGTEVRAVITKSRMGTFKRECTFKILWGGGESVAIDEREAWYDTLVKFEVIKTGKFNEITFADGEVVKFRSSQWNEMLKDESFYSRVKELIKHYLVDEFANENSTVNMSHYYTDLSIGDDLNKDKEEVESIE